MKTAEEILNEVVEERNIQVGWHPAMKEAVLMAMERFANQPETGIDIDKPKSESNG